MLAGIDDAERTSWLRNERYIGPRMRAQRDER
jgi:hypothetical protein